MFKIGKLDQLEQEEIEVKTVHQTHYNYKEKIQDEYDTLEFNVKGNIKNKRFLYVKC